MILRAAWVVPVSSPPIRDGYVEIAGDRIAAVGAWHSGLSGSIDLGNAILTPGLINPHTHLELTCYAGRIPHGPFWQWLPQLVRLRREPGAIQRETQAVVDGAWMSLRAGVTCVGDISRRNIAWRALKPLPIRKVCFVELLALADDPPRNVDELSAALDEIEEDDLLHAGISPHAPYSVSHEQVHAAIWIARLRKRPWTMHLAETPEEIEFLRGDAGRIPPVLVALMQARGVRSPEMPPAQYIASCGGDDYGGSLVHLNYLDSNDIAALAGAPHVAVYCPRAHRFFGHPAHPFQALRAAGMKVAIGTDSLASNESLSPLDELHFIATHVADSPSPAELFEMATLTAACALGVSHRLGSLEPGKLADLAAFEWREEEGNAIQALVMHPRPANCVFVAGRRVL